MSNDLYETVMTLPKAISIFVDIENEKYSITEKLESIEMVLNMPTHNSISKAEIIKAFQWFAFTDTTEIVENDVKCKDCQYLMFSDMYGECSKAYKGIVKPNDSCGKGKLREIG